MLKEILHRAGSRVGLIALLLSCVLTASPYDISGRVTDEAGEPLLEATVRLFRPDSTMVKGTAADIDGNYKLTGIRPGRYYIETNYIGFAPSFLNIEVTNQSLNLRPIVMSEGTLRLSEVTVTGVRTPMRVMTDTIEYTADSYVTRPNAVVEDLLRRLPGVEVGADGSITANGKQVTRILIDGQEFFSDDPTVASRNLPANMVDRLQVIDRKSDLARLTGVDDGEDETVINLTVKSGMKNGWFGTAEAGYGTDNRYGVSFNISRFHSENQFTLLGNFNNLNQLGFTDGNGNRFRRFGGDRGITTSRAIGFNFNVGNGEIIRVGGDVLYSNSDRNTRQRSDRQYLFPDSTSYYNSNSRTRDRGHNVRGDFRVLWKPDSFNTLEVRPNFSFNFNKSESLDSAWTFAGDPNRTAVNRTLNTGSSDGKSYEAGARLIYTHNFSNHRGRSFSIMGNYRMSNVRENSDSYSWNRFFLLGDLIDEYDQYQDNHTWSNSIRARVSWTEPLGDSKNGNFLVAAYAMTYRWNNADRLTYDRYYDEDPITGLPSGSYIDVYNPDLSNQFRNKFFTQQFRIGYQKVTKSTNMEVGVTFNPSTSQSLNLTNSDKSIPTRKVFNVAPFFRYRYKMGRNRSLQFNYRSRASEPSMAQLQPVADMTNPLRVVQGNPNLDPSFTHYLMARFQDFDMEHQRSIMAMAHFDIVQNSIVSKTVYDATTGGQLTTYENVNGVWSGRAMMMFSQPLRNKKFTVNANFFSGFRREVGFNNGERNSTFTADLNFRPGITFRPDHFEAELRPFYRVQLTSSAIRTNVPTTVHNYGATVNLTGFTDFGLQIATDLNFNATKGYANGYDTSLWMWNAQISYSFLKGQTATVALKVNDILNQTKSINRTVTANYIQDTDYNVLGRYGMVTFTYRFNTFGQGNQPEDRNMMRHGWGGPPPGGPGGRR